MSNRIIAKHMARMRHARGVPPPNLIWRTTDGHCFYCGLVVRDRRLRTVDHLTPVRRGGESTEENLVPACRTCNRAKDRMTLEEYRATQGGGLFWGEQWRQARRQA